MSDECTPELSALYTEYQALCHAMQTGVAYDHGGGSQDGTPKHLRVGVNTAMCDHGALVEILIAKGVMTEREYVEGLIKHMRMEVDRYRARLAERYGKSVDEIQLA